MQQKPTLRFAVSFFLFTALWLGAAVANAQKVTPEDSLYVVSLYTKSNAEPNPQIGLQYADSMVNFSIKKKFSRGMAWGYRQKATVYSRMQQKGQAMYFIDKGIISAAKGRHYKELVNQLLFSSMARNEYAQYDRAFADVTKAVNIASKVKDTSLLGKSYTQLGRCYYAKQDLPKSMAYTEKALGLFRKSKDIEGIRETLTVLATANIEAEKYAQGLAQLKEVETIAPEVPMSPFRLPQLYGSIGWCYDKMGKNELAVSYYNKALEVIAQLGESLLVTEVVIKDNLGNLYLEQGKYELAEKYLNEALAGAMKAQTPDEFRSVYGHLGKLSFLKKQYKQAYEYQEKYRQYSDSVMNNEKMEALESLSVKFQTREVADKNKLLEKENALQKAQAEQEKAYSRLMLYVSIAVVLFLLTAILFGYYYFRQQSIITANKNNELNQKLLLTQMSPHFIFNSLDNIQGLIFDGQKQEAVNYLSKFSKLTRQILENSSENYITLEEERQMIENYIGIQQLLYQSKFGYTIDIDPAIDPESILLPPMLTQPFIENAIKHGLRDKSDHGQIGIRFYFEGEKLFVSISDNGRGFSDQPSGTNKSLAMKITNDRLRHIFKVKDFELHRQNTTDVQNVVNGARVYFEIPYLYEN